jgi:Membrane protease subunits, stomatin/prohibitin homologs
MEEKKVWYINGYLGLVLLLLLAGYGIFNIYTGIAGISNELIDAMSASLKIFEWLPSGIPLGIAILVVVYIFLTSMTIVTPNQAKIVMLFGKYLGTIRQNGMFITIPFTTKTTISLKISNFNSNKLKVNDVDGNPIEIAAVIVFKVTDTAKARFDVEHYESFVEIQSETAVRHVATKYPYDSFSGDEITLRANVIEVSNELLLELKERLAVAGVEVLEARLSHLAYSTEIASAMLQRQQAKAILSARQLIVEGAVSMAQQALDKLEHDQTLHFSESAKIQLVNNLLVSIISEKGTQPIISMDDV